ncbi:MAG TPA: nuclear transport factor 2 family protein [Mycobacteriales bacterium]|jgi:hypothetical protein|nr:nuclear transport factor 2 family protein [Mycobacteriales bacterium]
MHRSYPDVAARLTSLPGYDPLPMEARHFTTPSAAQLVDVEALRQLKYRYCRLLDTKHFTELGELFVEDGTASYGGGAITLTGRAEIVGFLTTSMGSERILTSHLVGHPEIGLSEDGRSATGSWALQDVVVLEEPGLVVRGASYYEDRYVRVGDAWRIAHTGYRRLYEEIGPRVEGTRTTASWWGTDGRSSLVGR